MAPFISFPLRDFEAYYAAGAAYLHGQDPYASPIWTFERNLPGVDARHMELLPFVGAPFGLPLWGLLAHLPFAAARLVWAAILLAAFAACVITSLRLAGGRATPLDFFLAFVLAVGFAPLTCALSLGQVALVSCAGITAALLASRNGAAAGTFAGALLAALQPNLAVVLLARLRDRRTSIALGAAALAAAAMSVWAVGGSAFARYFGTIAEHTRAERFAGIQTTPAAIAFAFGAPEFVAQSAGLTLAAAVVALIALQVRSGRFAPVEGTALACAALPFALPYSHEADMALIFFPALLCLRRASGAPALAALAGTLFVAVNWLDLAQRTTSPFVTTALALCASIGALAIARDAIGALPRWVPVAVPAATLAVVVTGWTLSAAHPLPVWPDALPASFSAPTAANVADLWAQEQRASGLAGHDPWSGFLRLLSLLGCAAIWAAASFALAEPVSAPASPRSEPLSKPHSRPAADGPSC